MAREFLVRKGLEEAQLEADLLVAHALGTDRLGMLLRLTDRIAPAQLDAAREVLVRRGRREPVAYITGRREFYGRPFLVGSGVLIPRPETELLVDQAREVLGERAEDAPAARVLDIGTGSGCLAVTLALEVQGLRPHAVDASEDALVWARQNGTALEADVEWVHGDGFEVLRTGAPWDVVVSNPPYIDPSHAEQLAPDVRDHEPGIALFGPAGDPDLWARELAQNATRFLAPGGVLLIELGYDQAGRLEESAPGIEIVPDLAGIPRVLRLKSNA
jgi:release factor glutamine methyltransferase